MSRVQSLAPAVSRTDASKWHRHSRSRCPNSAWPSMKPKTSASVANSARGKFGQRVQNDFPLAHLSQGKFANDEGMRQHATGRRAALRAIIAAPQMIDPNRGVDQNQARAGRRRGAGSISGSLPPSRASRRALSRSISALERLAHKARLLFQAGEGLGFGDEFIIERERGPHCRVPFCGTDIASMMLISMPTASVNRGRNGLD